MKNLKVFAALGLLVLAGTSSLFGAVSLRLNDGVNPILTIADGSVVVGAVDANGAVGAVTYVGSFGVWNLNVSTGVGTALTGPGALDLNSVNNATGAGNLTIEFSESGVTPSFAGWQMLFGGTLTAPAGSTVTFTAYESNSNTLFTATNLIGTVGPFTPGAFSGSGGGSVAGVTAPYSLTERIVISMTGAGQYSGDANLAPVPEPGSILLLGTMLVGTAAALRRRLGARS